MCVLETNHIQRRSLLLGVGKREVNPTGARTASVQRRPNAAKHSDVAHQLHHPVVQAAANGLDVAEALLQLSHLASAAPRVFLRPRPPLLLRFQRLPGSISLLAYSLHLGLQRLQGVCV